MFNNQYERPAMVLLSAMWGLAAVLAIAAFTVSAFAATKPLPEVPTVHPVRLAHAESVESVTRPSMLREPRHAISKHKLD